MTQTKYFGCKVQKIAVIGAGSAGIAAAKYLVAENAFQNITVLEQRASSGGMWNYTTANGPPELSTPIYDELESNIPKTLMQYSGLPFPDEEQLLPDHSAVLKYLQQYAQDVEDLVTYNTQVSRVVPEGTSQWAVTTQDLASQESSTRVYDAVVVANGHFEKPKVPDIKGLAAWTKQHPGSLFHSMAYRNEHNFKDKKIVIVGTGASGSEIATHVERLCQHPLVISQRRWTPKVESDSRRLVLPAIEELIPETRTVRFVNGHLEHGVDYIILCTGYLCDYPFLPDFPVVYDGKRTRNLYRHMFYIPRPTLAFIAMPLKSVPFPISESQAAVVSRVWSSRLALPSLEKMRRWDQAVTEHDREHEITSPLEAAHFNISLMQQFYGYCLEATRRPGLQHGGQGVLPPRWGEREIWIRERLGPIKAAFTARGAARHHIRTLEELGFDFDQWKRVAASGEAL
ncbi:putative flavin dependent monooxygenase [Nemania sp. FL0031]|nr:putative flavin dependent monooxygenase [Nemania sp. FL0031]